MVKRVIFGGRFLPYWLLLPQMLIIVFCFYGPAVQAFISSFQLLSPFGQTSQFVWFDNFIALFKNAEYHQSLLTTLIFSVAVMALSLALGLVLAVCANRVIRGSGAYKSLLIFPYAVAPVLSGVLWLFIFHPTTGVITYLINRTGLSWNPLLNAGQAMALVVLASSWKQMSYNFIFFLAGLQAVPKAVIEAASVDGAGPMRRFWAISFPLLTPTTFFLMVINLTYAFFDTFGVIHAVTQGGPGQSTYILVYRVYADGFVGLNLGSSSAQSVVLMFIVISLTVVQFRYVERHVQYEMT